ncbi:MAG: FxsA family protein [Paracoccaceae bacterium]
MFLFIIIFTSVPLIEIYLFIIMGGFIGSLKTILLIVLTAVIGGFLIKREGIKTLNNLKFSKISEPKDFIKVIGDGLFILISGILLLTPGFATDLIGFILFLKWIRVFIIEIALKKIMSSKIS